MSDPSAQPEPERPALADAALQIAVNCADPHRLVEFWAEVLGYEIDQDPEMIRSLVDAGAASEADVMEHRGVLVWKSGSAMFDPEGRRPRWYFQQVPEPKVGRNRLHLDIQLPPDGSIDRAAEAQRLVALGATIEGEGAQGSHTWLVMIDPEGNEFCLAG